LDILINQKNMTYQAYFSLFDNRYTALVEQFQVHEPAQTPSEIPIQLLKDSLINVRQHEAFLRILLVSAAHCMST